MALLWELRWAVCFSDLPSAGAGMGCWIVGIWGGGWGFAGGVFRFGKKLFEAAYHLHDECHIFNIFGVMMRSE